LPTALVRIRMDDNEGNDEWDGYANEDGWMEKDVTMDIQIDDTMIIIKRFCMVFSRLLSLRRLVIMLVC